MIPSTQLLGCIANFVANPTHSSRRITMASKSTTKKPAALPEKPKRPANPKASRKAAPAKKAPAKAKKIAKPASKAAEKRSIGTYADMAANRTEKSTVVNPVKVVWDLCESMKQARRKEVIAAAVAQGVNYYTARTQYQLWLAAKNGRA
jgi:hypothetical protein